MAMRFDHTPRFKKQYGRLPADIRVRANKQLSLLLNNPQHPSLRLKKMAGYKNRWELSVTMHYRITFAIEPYLAEAGIAPVPTVYMGCPPARKRYLYSVPSEGRGWGDGNARGRAGRGCLWAGGWRGQVTRR